MKKNNKGFSLVELIIVIAIMAILAGALAPALIKYINKSRRSTDVQNADSLRTALQTALSDPDAADATQQTSQLFRLHQQLVQQEMLSRRKFTALLVKLHLRQSTSPKLLVLLLLDQDSILRLISQQMRL